MTTFLIVIAAVAAVLLLLNLKTSRPDGTHIGRVHPYRRLMQFIMPTRNESVVYFDEYVVADRLLEYLQEARKRFHVDVTHCLVAATARAFHENPTMNRFAVGRRLYQRDGIWISFSMKRQKKGRKAKLSAVKKRIDPGEETFYGFCQRLQESIEVERSGKKTYQDKEFALLNRIPRPVLRLGVRALKTLDYYNLLPKSFIENDAMFTSLFIANLGSLGMKAGYHHLYEWGTSPLFMMVGAIEERAIVEDGEVVARKVLPIRFTFDERVEDGLNAGIGIRTALAILEDPFRHLGCLAEDGSDDHPIGEPADDAAKADAAA
ncbi:MAG: 2-oxo acid dehydrogenase subunit E2 [Myxococcota bacterium]